jgi:flagellar biosynthesis GTPase FlhF
MDLQRIKSTLIRQMLDNIYLTNNPRHLVVESAATDETYDDLLTSKPGDSVRARSADGGTAAHAFSRRVAQGLVEYMDQTAEVRTGISRHNQGLDPDDLNKTATGVNLIQQAAAQRVELIARIFAFSVQKAVRGILGLIKKHAQQERIIRVSGAPLQTDPAQWKNDMTVSVNVGLGTGNRDQITSQLMALLTVQQQIVLSQGGTSGPLVYAKNIYDTVARLSQNAGFKSNFAVQDPTVPPPPSVTGPPQPPKPDPTQAIAQAEMQLQQQKAQSDAQLNEQKAAHQQQLSQQKAGQEMQIASQQAQHQQHLDSAKLQQQFVLSQQKAQNDMEIEKLRAANDMRIEQMKAENAHQLAVHQASLAAQNQPAQKSAG